MVHKLSFVLQAKLMHTGLLNFDIASCLLQRMVYFLRVTIGQLTDYSGNELLNIISVNHFPKPLFLFIWKNQFNIFKIEEVMADMC